MSFAPKQFIRSVDFLSTENSTNTSTGCVNIYGGMSVSKDSYLTHMIVVGTSTVANLTITGNLITSTGNLLTGTQWTNNDTSIYFGTSGSALVGIGTTTPNFNLDISGGSRITGGLTVGNLNVNTGASITNILNTTICTGTVIVTSGSIRASFNSHTLGNIFTTGGNVGIGTTSPGSRLEVNGTIKSGDITVGNINFTGSLYQNGSAYLGSQWTTTSGNTLTYTSGSININSGFSSSFNSNTLGNIFTTGGNVGIATTSPGNTLDVSGTARFTTSITTGAIYSTNQTTTNIVATNISTSNLVASTVASNVVSATTITGSNLSLSGNLSVAGTLTTVNITSTNLVNTNVSAGVVVATTLLSASGNSNTIGSIFTTGGNVGIGTASPGTTLDISGTIRATTSLTTGALYSTNLTSTNIVGTTSTVSNSIFTNISSGTLNLSTGITSASVQATNINASTSTIGILLNTNAVSTNISSGTLNLSTGITTASVQATNINATTETIGTSRVTTSLLAIGNSNTMGSIFTTGGNVGIGTSQPSSRLSVNGGIHAATFNSIIEQGAYVQWNRSSGGGETWLINQRGSGNNDSIRLGSAATNGSTVTEWWRFQSNNLYNMVGGNVFIDGSVATTQWVFGYNTPKHTSGISPLQVYNNATDRNLALQVTSKGTSSGIDSVQITVPLQSTFNSNTIGSIITTGGNVGLGTGTPQTKLHIEDGSLFIGDVSSGFSTSVPSSPGSNTTPNGYRLFFDNSFNGTAGTGIPANKIVLHNNNWTGGFGMELTGVTYHSGQNHRFYTGAGNSSSYGTLMFDMGAATNVHYTNTNGEGNLKIINSNSGGSAYAIMRIGNSINDTVMFMNSSTRTSDGGPSTFTIRNDIGGVRLQGGGANNTLWLSTGANIGIGTTTPSYPLHVSGDIYATGDVISFSDARLKTDVITIENALEKVSSLRGVYYTNANTNTRETGVIAQEIAEILPEVVADKGEYLGVAYGNIVGILIEAIKELKDKVNTLEAQLNL